MINETLRQIDSRRSIRRFRSRPVESEWLQALAQAGQRAPSAQPGSRHFAVVQDPDLLERLSDSAKLVAVKAGIPELDKLGENPDFHCLYGAPAAIVISGRQDGVAFEQDCSAAAQNILIGAHSLGLGSCWVFFATLAFAGPDGPALREKL